MLTDEALEEREWAGLGTLRQLLGAKRKEFKNSYYPTSTSESEFELYQRIALLAALVTHERDAIIRGIESQPLGETRTAVVQGAWKDLEVLAGVIRHFSKQLESVAQQVRSVQARVGSQSQSPGPAV